MAKRKKKTEVELVAQLIRICKRLVRKFSPDTIQSELGRVYEEYAALSQTEAEVEFWMKCYRASYNLASGMNKWGHEMVEEMMEEE